ncbi:type IV secretion system protein [Campylobacter sp. MIT 97-5078]|uniref:type IV secretion system protein n=1 Tax=Campylobacter sp. MIT 97-5078 TaxID=1548153 RepID=UPI0005136112|nr:type IV secretion system protein [Campylobacter sp. MIT 97-5078]KGI55670.1 hypothetical protein LR59_10985 [Campylobacter sp. MIT 97-5078]KGI56808.1 hypothetical protein LR59_04820 [Campylobacter sp. MIT 97-5078]TQR25585.1 hypothetical protein DMB91_07215 [Campylobacter sp. MIT 97-5078]
MEKLDIGIATTYNRFNAMIANLGANIDATMYSSLSYIFYNSLAYCLIGIILVFWCIRHLKSGFAKDDLFKGGIWLILFIFIYGTLSSLGTYQEFKSWFLLPQKLLKAMVSSFAGGGNVGEIMERVIETPLNFWVQGYEFGIQAQEEGDNALGYVANKGGSFDDMFNIITSFFRMFLWLVYILLLAIVCAGIIIMQVASSFASFIFGSFAPIMMICLLTPQTRGNFFSWLKNYIAITLFVPMTMFSLMVMDKINEFAGIQSGEFIYRNVFYTFFIGLLNLLIGIYILRKIPEWINTMIGSTENGGGFTAGAAQAVLGATAGAGMLVGGLAGKTAFETANMATGGKLGTGLNALQSYSQSKGGMTGVAGELFKGGFKNLKKNIQQHQVQKNGFNASSQYYNK